MFEKKEEQEEVVVEVEVGGGVGRWGGGGEEIVLMTSLPQCNICCLFSLHALSSFLKSFYLSYLFSCLCLLFELPVCRNKLFLHNGNFKIKSI